MSVWMNGIFRKYASLLLEVRNISGLGYNLMGLERMFPLIYAEMFYLNCFSLKLLYFFNVYHFFLIENNIY